MKEKISNDDEVKKSLQQDGFVSIQCICLKCLPRVIGMTLAEFPKNLVSIDINPLQENFYQVNIALSDSMDDIIE